MNPFNRTFTQTFPCGTSLYPCYSRYGFVTPVRFDNFVRNTDIPFYINKYKSIYDIKQYCHKEPEPVNYIEEIQQPNLQYKSYYVNDYEMYRANKKIKNQYESIVF